ncbi:MAG: endonuclease domain-containing protein [Actinomycetota bacterium]|nr:endonuclease domain-containing protein [Actinomycetota bacterium]
MIVTARDVDERVARLALSQYGAFSRAQALRVGATDRVVGRRIAAGAWLTLEPGTYALRAAPASWHRSLMAAVLAAGPPAVVSHRAAAALHGFAGFRRGCPEIVVRRGRVSSTRLARVHSAVELPAADCGSREGIPVTRPARTILDVAAGVHFHRLLEVYDEAVAARLLTHTELSRCLERAGRRGLRGTAAARRLLAERAAGEGIPTGRLEHEMQLLLRRGDVPAPVCQFAAPWRTAGRQRVDFAWPDQRLILEADGRRWHTRDADFIRDRARDREAVTAGWKVLRVTWEDVRDRSTEIVTQVRACLREAA